MVDLIVAEGCNRFSLLGAAVAGVRPYAGGGAGGGGGDLATVVIVVKHTALVGYGACYATAVVTACRFCSVLGAGCILVGGVFRKGVFYFGAFSPYGACCAAAVVTACGLGTVAEAVCVFVVNVFGVRVGDGVGKIINIFVTAGARV